MKQTPNIKQHTVTESKILNLLDALKHLLIGMVIAAVCVGIMHLLVHLPGS